MPHIRPVPLLRGALLATCSGLAMAIAVPRAEAASVVVNYDYSAGATGPSTGIFSQSSPTGLDVLPSDTGPDGSSIFGHHYGYDNGVFGTRSSGSGNFEKLGDVLWSNTYTNQSATPQAMTGSFLIDSGTVTMSMPDTTGSVYAVIFAQIEVNDELKFLSAAEMDMSDGGTPSFQTAGTVLNPGGQSLSPGFGSYSWGSYLGTVDLGTLAPGQSVTVEYLLASYVIGSLAGCGGGYGDYGGLTVGNGDYGGYGGGLNCGSSYGEARIGDPFNVPEGGSQFTVNFSEVTTPEPASALVLGAGLAALAFRRRRQAA